MSRPYIKAANRILREVGDGPIVEAWRKFTETVTRTVDISPYHLGILLKQIKLICGTQPPGKIAFLKEPGFSF